MKNILLKLLNPIVSGQIRHFLTLASGYLVTTGMLNADDSAQLVQIVSGAIIGAFGFGASALDKTKNVKPLDFSDWTDKERNSIGEPVTVFKPAQPEYNPQVRGEIDYLQRELPIAHPLKSSGFKFSESSAKKLESLHPQMVALLAECLYDPNCPYDFGVIEALRTIEKQREYLASGASRTLNSKHLKQPDGFSHAVDLKIVIDGVYITTAPKYETLNNHIQAVASRMRQAGELNIDVGWGGNMWAGFIDAGHWQINHFTN